MRHIAKCTYDMFQTPSQPLNYSDPLALPASRSLTRAPEQPRPVLKIHQRGVQWKQGVVIRMMLCIILLYDTTPIHCTPPPTAARYNR